MVRHRVRYKKIDGKWYAIRYTIEGEEIDRSPGADTYEEAEGFGRNMERYGAWRKS